MLIATYNHIFVVLITNNARNATVPITAAIMPISFFPTLLARGTANGARINAGANPAAFMTVIPIVLLK